MTDNTSTHPSSSVEERLMLLAEAERIANMGSWIWEPGPKVIWSDQLLRILGLEPEPRPTTDDFFNALHPDDRERVRATTEHAATTGIMPSFQCRILRPDGEERIVRGAGTVIMNPDGQLVRVVGSITDITESRLASRRLKNAVRRLNDAQRVAGLGSFIYDLQRHEQEWSEGMFRLLGMPPGRTPSWTDTLGTLSPEDQQAMLAWGRHFVSGTRPPPLRYRITRTDGQTRTFETHAAYVPYEDEGQASRIIGTTIDRTEQLAVEQHLQRAAHMEAIGTLAAGVAHDFRTDPVPGVGPRNCISAFSSVG